MNSYRFMASSSKKQNQNLFFRTFKWNNRLLESLGSCTLCQTRCKKKCLSKIVLCHVVHVHAYTMTTFYIYSLQQIRQILTGVMKVYFPLHHPASSSTSIGPVITKIMQCEPRRLHTHPKWCGKTLPWIFKGLWKKISLTVSHGTPRN